MFGCGSGGTPDCGSDEALALVSQIAHEEYEEYADFVEVTPTMVVQQRHDPASDRYFCSARVIVKGWNKHEQAVRCDPLSCSGCPPLSCYEDDIDFHISSDATDSGKFIVEVFGLN